MLTIEQIKEIVDEIQYRPDWEFHVGKYENSTITKGIIERSPWLQIRFFADDEMQHCRKWQLSFHMTPSEIVRTAWKAVLAAEEHEAAERFRYKGVMIYNPHFDVDALVEFAKGGNLTARDSKEKVVLIGDKRIVLTVDGNTLSARYAEDSFIMNSKVTEV
jgi:hypothetical protein